MTDLQKNMLTGALIGAGAVLSRLPFLESAPFHTDSLHFLRGVTKTGIAHPPGYIGYCMSGRVIYYIIGNAHSLFWFELNCHIFCRLFVISAWTENAWRNEQIERSYDFVISSKSLPILLQCSELILHYGMRLSDIACAVLRESS